MIANDPAMHIISLALVDHLLLSHNWFKLSNPGSNWDWQSEQETEVKEQMIRQLLLTCWGLPRLASPVVSTVAKSCRVGLHKTSFSGSDTSGVATSSMYRELKMQIYVNTDRKNVQTKMHAWLVSALPEFATDYGPPPNDWSLFRHDKLSPVFSTGKL